jgi:hypothetical protein
MAVPQRALSDGRCRDLFLASPDRRRQEPEQLLAFPSEVAAGAPFARHLQKRAMDVRFDSDDCLSLKRREWMNARLRELAYFAFRY